MARHVSVKRIAVFWIDVANGPIERFDSDLGQHMAQIS
jgi:hypothetical protein